MGESLREFLRKMAAKDPNGSQAPSEGESPERADEGSGYGKLARFYEAIQDLYADARRVRLLGFEIRLNRERRIYNAISDYDKPRTKAFGRAILFRMLRASGYRSSLTSSDLSAYRVISSIEGNQGGDGPDLDVEARMESVKSSIGDLQKFHRSLGISLPF